MRLFCSETATDNRCLQNIRSEQGICLKMNLLEVVKYSLSKIIFSIIKDDVDKMEEIIFGYNL